MKESIKSNALRIKKATRMNPVRKLIALVAVAFCAALVVPVLPVWNTVTVYADSSFDATKNSAITSLRNLYNKYNKKYYTEQEYKELTDLYNKAIKKISSMKYSKYDTDDIAVQYWKYEEKMKKIQPSILIKYQDKVVKSLEKAYNKLLKNNAYSSFATQQLSICKDIGVNTIRAAKNKTNVKKAKKTALQNLKNVITLPDETRSDIISYISDNKDISKKKKAELIEKLEGMTDVEDMLLLGTQIDYEKPETVTIDQINNRIDQLVNKYPAYTEDEIRCLVATANLDYIDDSEIFNVYKVNNFEDLKNQMLKADELIRYAGEITGVERNTRWFERNTYFDSDYIKYKDIIWVNDLIIRDDIKTHADYLCSLLKSMVEEDYTKKQCKEDISGSFETNGFLSMLKLQQWFYNYPLENVKGKKYDSSLAINVKDKRLKGSEGYMLDKFIYTGAYLMIDSRGYNAYITEELSEYNNFQLDLKYRKNNYLSNKIEEMTKNQKTIKALR